MKRTYAAGLLALGLHLACLCSVASAASSYTWGIKYANDPPPAGTVDGRAPARKMGQVLNQSGWANALHDTAANSTGILVDQATRTRNGAFIFGHGGDNSIITGGDWYASNNLFYAGALVIPGISKSSSWLSSVGMTELDDLKWIILAGCDTGDMTDSYGWLSYGREHGVDSVIGWNSPGQNGSGSVFASDNDDPQSGPNYFWTRFAGYMGDGYKFERAISEAGIDSRNRWGTDYGWERRWRAGGTASQPADFKIVPPAVGKDDDNSGSAQRASASVPPVRTVDSSGQLTFLSRPRSSEGATRFAPGQLETQAEAFLTRAVGQPLELISAGPADRVPGDALYRFEYRSVVAGVPGPVWAVLELDERTGKVATFELSSARPDQTEFLISEQQAISIALTQTTEAVEIDSAAADVWKGPRWTIVLRSSAPQETGQTQIMIDGRTGQVINKALALQATPSQEAK